MEWAKRNEIRSVDRDFYVEGFLDPGTGGGFGGLTTISRFDTGFPILPSQAAVDQVMAGLAPPGTINPDTDFYFNADGTAFIAQGGLGYNGLLAPDTLQYKRLTQRQSQRQFHRGTRLEPARALLGVRSRDVRPHGQHASVRAGQFHVGGGESGVRVFAVDAVLGRVDSERRTRARCRPSCKTAARTRGRTPERASRGALTRDTDFIGPRTSDNRNRMFQIMTGVEGDIGEYRVDVRSVLLARRDEHRTIGSAGSLRRNGSQTSSKRRTSARAGSAATSPLVPGLREHLHERASRSSRASSRRRTASTRCRST